MKLSLIERISHLGYTDIKLIKYVITTCFQLVLFLILTFLGGYRIPIYTQCEYFEYKLYYFANALFIKFQTTFGHVYSNLTDQSCSIPMNINPHSFPIKLALTYHSLLVIAMLYTWHQTIRLSSCILTSLVIVMIIFGTNLVLIYDQIQTVSFIMSGAFYTSFSIVTATYIPGYIEISLHQLCEPKMSFDDWYIHLQNGTSTCARFYRWIKRTEKQWNIEEKLILTIILTPISLSIAMTLYLYMVPSESSTEHDIHLEFAYTL